MIPAYLFWLISYYFLNIKFSNTATSFISYNPMLSLSHPTHTLSDWNTPILPFIITILTLSADLRLDIISETFLIS